MLKYSVFFSYPWINQTLSKVFMSKHMELELAKYFWAFTPRCDNDNIGKMLL